MFPSFAKADCRACPAGTRCTAAARGNRMLTLRPKEIHESAHAARKEQNSEAWRAEPAAANAWPTGSRPDRCRRPGVEQLSPLGRKVRAEAVSDVVRGEVGRVGIKANVVEPGIVDTPMCTTSTVTADTLADCVTADVIQVFLPSRLSDRTVDGFVARTSASPTAGIPPTVPSRTPAPV
ncbi:hypothetical protein GTY44_04250 [Streptomyces sp. SID5914]|nr:hypothetical protein [Streptomyces sp. SID5914]